MNKILHNFLKLKKILKINTFLYLFSYNYKNKNNGIIESDK